MISFRRFLVVCAQVLLLSVGPQALAVPEISRFEPMNGSAGTEVEIFGRELVPADKVYFNGVEASFSVNVVTGSIKAIVPADAVTGRIFVFTPNGFAASSENFVIGEQGPKILSFTPQGPVGADVVLVLNTSVPLTKVDFNGLEAPFRPASDTLILTRVPAGASSGPITVTFDGGSTISDVSFIVTQLPVQGLPTITGFVPTAGSVGREVLITGMNLADGILAVQFGGVTASFVQRANGVLATVPVGAQTGDISVIALQGVGTSSNPFVVLPLPEILRFDPTTGPVGASIEIFGTHIQDANAVFFSGVSAQFEVNAVTGSLMAFVPPDADSGRITVTTPNGTAVSSANFVLMEPARITAFTPSGNSGTNIVVVLNAMVPVTRVEFNGIGAPFSQMPLNTGSLVLAWVPENASSGPISVLFPDGRTTTADSFTVTAQPSERLPAISGFSPSEATAGAQILISGTNLADEVFAVQFKDVPASFVQAPEGILATVPAGVHSGPISVITLYGVARSSDSFVLGPPYLSPSKTFRVYWDREACLVWDAAGDPAISGYRLHLSDPANRLFFIMDIPGGETATTCGNFDLRSALPKNGIYSAYLTAYNFSYQESEPSERIYFELLPSVDSISASGGYVEDRILISGTGFVDIAEVRFNGIQAQYHVVSPTQIEAEVPRTTSSGPLELVTSGGAILAASAFAVIPSYDLTVNQANVTQSAFAGTELTYTLTVQNRGPLEAQNVVLSMTLPTGIAWDSVAVDGVAMVLQGTDVVVNIGTVPSDAAVQVATKLTLKTPGLYSVASVVRSDGTDRNLANNSVIESFEVLSVPSLRIRSVGDGQIELSWLATNGDLRLESTTPEGLSAGNWQTVSAQARLVDGSIIVILPIGESPQVFRLRAINR